MDRKEYIKRYGHMFEMCKDERLIPASGDEDQLMWQMLRDAIFVIEAGF